MPPPPWQPAPAFAGWIGSDPVGKKKAGHATWFKIFSKDLNLLENAAPESVGKAVVAALQYLESGMLPENMDVEMRLVFAQLKSSVDESVEAYRTSSAAGRLGNEKRWSKGKSHGIAPRYDAIPGDRVVSGGIENTEDRNPLYFKALNAAPGLEAGEQGKVYFDEAVGEWRRRT